jgi:DNA-binding NtrC family response regulator
MLMGTAMREILTRANGNPMKKRWKILVVDDEESVRESLAAWLRKDGYTVDVAKTGEEGIAQSRQTAYAVHFIDLNMPGIDGIQTMQEIRKINPDSTIVIITAYPTVTTAIRAIKQGAHEYLVKPFNPQDVSLMVDRNIRVKSLQRENEALRKRLLRRYQFEDIVSKNARMHEIFQLIRDVANLRSTVLIEGESGTGKELIARAIHYSGDRSTKTFVAVPCAALTETLLESELFGHEKGAFTGATTQKKGKFELANGGTLLLDEIGDISPKLQIDLLRVLQERKFYRVGGTAEIAVDVRVIAATNVDLEHAVHAGVFRDDLYYRLNVINIRIPPLRERREDIPLLAAHFVEKLAHELAKDMMEIDNGALRVLLDYDWPGNVRELENAVERALITCRGNSICEKDFAFLRRREPAALPANMTLREIEKQLIQAAVERTGGNIKQAAEELGIDRSTLYERLKRYGITRETS